MTGLWFGVKCFGQLARQRDVRENGLVPHKLPAISVLGPHERFQFRKFIANE